MSEFKGQLLGIILVIAVFAVIGTILVSAFYTSAQAIGDQITTVADTGLLIADGQPIYSLK